LLDATGLASAITWYLDGFGKRSGIETSLELPRQLDRLAVNVETALFRIMQEALTNVHRHAASPRVEVTLTAEKQSLTLSIRDYGKGIPEQILNEFNQSGTHVGVGLAGIRERVKELGGTFEIRNEEPGTTLRAIVPVSGQRQTFFADTSSQIYSSLAS
jgi:signal transduction histidine kinase